MANPTKIFMTGVTGFIGGSVLGRFLDHKDASQFGITALVRSPAKAEKLKSIGVNAVVGSLDDIALTENLASDADVVVSMADCDTVPFAEAILRGMKRYHQKNGTVPILIHTSGTGVLTDDAAGDRFYDTIYNDLDADQIETLADTAQHRYVDLAIVKADKEGYVKTYIVLPSIIWGLGSGRLVDLGIQHNSGRGRGGMVGAGKNIWNNVHIDDIAELFIVLFDAIKENKPGLGHGREGFYFGENGEHNYYQVGKAIAEGLVALGKATNPEPSTFTDEEIKVYFNGRRSGAQTPWSSKSIQGIGWKPVKTTQDMLDGIRAEIEAELEVGVPTGSSYIPPGSQ
ncbi:hypothetical protein CPB84DRAFT_1848538 [Gymnopilus junonius]|uniref:NAD(P)-binding domain-containing protein n=1 Tax=Gymnopilus junonius TaxID=109634 RepID=A0A9P5TKR5_GYMJU|nr:hypothetical protein CPB84DRAFT_1848538 [Gymnopilus junonius]